MTSWYYEEFFWYYAEFPGVSPPFATCKTEAPVRAPRVRADVRVGRVCVLGP